MAQRPDGWWYPYIFVAFFAVVVAVNGVMIYFAISTFNGLRATDHFRKGLAYDDAIAMQKAQEERGWTLAVTTTAQDPQPTAEGGTVYPATVRLRFTDRAGDPVTGLTLRARAVRPTQVGHDFTLTFNSLGEGLYGTVADFPLPGAWDLMIGAQRQGEMVYRHEERVVLRPDRTG